MTWFLETRGLYSFAVELSKIFKVKRKKKRRESSYQIYQKAGILLSVFYRIKMVLTLSIFIFILNAFKQLETTVCRASCKWRKWKCWSVTSSLLPE